MRLPSWPVWLIALGGVLMVAAAVSALLTVGFVVTRLSELLRAEVVSSNELGIILLGVLGALLFSIGVILYVVVGSLSHARAERGYASIGTILACFAAAAIIANILTLPYFIAQAQQHRGEALTLSPGGLVLAVVTMDGALLAVVYFRIVRPRVLTWEQLGLTLADAWQRVRLGLVVGIAVIVADAILEAALAAFGIHQTQQEVFLGVRDATPGQFVGILLAAAFIAPVCEEVFFRGYIFTAVRQRYGVALAFIASSLLFALAHLNAQAFLPILLIGVGFCYVYWRTGSLVPSIVAHAMNNALALAALYVSK